MTTPLNAASLRTPVGALSLVVDGEVVVASGFTPVDELVARLQPALAERGVRRRRELGPVTSAVRDYLDGDLVALDTLDVHQPGGAFLQDVWRAMRTIPAGRTWTYARLAAEAGRPTAVRAAGSGCARNLLAPIVPCHRVVRSGGGLGGYFYGLDVKRWLLEHESALPV